MVTIGATFGDPELGFVLLFITCEFTEPGFVVFAVLTKVSPS